ncbi:hypothetical protein JW935_21835 [candidate division KSB1 bacterium]|nr:hypothetical protein [candidate division KSB1 bacterium]
MNKIYIHTKCVIDRSCLEPVMPRRKDIISNNSKRPQRPIFYWLQDTPLGKELFIALYTKRCRWAKCSFCSLPSVSSPGDVSEMDILAQVHYVLSQLSAVEKNSVKRVFLSNNGSILDTCTMPVDVLDKIFTVLNGVLVRMEIIELETRFDSITEDRILSLLDKLHRISGTTKHRPSPLQLQISAGYETQDPFLRNRVLNKGYPEEMVQGVYNMLADIYHRTGYPVSIDENVLLKPAAFMSRSDAIAECAETVRHIQRLGDYFGLPVSVRINPVFVADGSGLHEQFLAGDYIPPTLDDVVSVLGLLEGNVTIPIHIGLNEEELDVPDGSFNSGSERDRILRNRLQKFNRSGDFGIFRRNVKVIEDADVFL